MKLALYDSQGLVCYLEQVAGSWVANFHDIGRLYTAAQLAEVASHLNQLNGTATPAGR